MQLYTHQIFQVKQCMDIQFHAATVEY